MLGTKQTSKVNMTSLHCSAQPPTQIVKTFIDQHRLTCGVEPICKVMQIAPLGYRRHAAQQRNPELRCVRAKQDATLPPLVHQVWQSNMQGYGADKVWHQFSLDGIAVGRCAVDRLTRRSSLRGAKRGKVVRITIGDAKAASLLDRVSRQFKTSLTHRRAPWKTKGSLELATLEWVSWFNHHRLLAPIGYMPPAEAEKNYHR
jgi:transposase InsO family protein